MSKRSARRSLKFDDLPSTIDEIHRLSDHGYVKVGNWDLAQICQHLNKTMRMSFEGAPFRVPRLLQPLARKLLFQKAMRGEPTYLPLKTVAQFQPEKNADATDAIAEYIELVDRSISDSSSLLDLHPVFGPISKPEWRMFHAWHTAHHLSFLIPNAADAQALVGSHHEMAEVSS